MIDLDPKNYQLLVRILQTHLPEGRVYVFGSRVSGRHHPFSDVDLLIDAKEPVPSDIIGDLKEAISESSLPVSVDLVDLHAISDGFKEIILKADKVLITTIE